MKKNLIATAICGLGLLGSGAASAVVISGVDFGPLGATNQISVGSLTETFISGSGQTLTGYGNISQVNGTTSYAGSNSLYFIVHDYISKNFTPSSTDFTGGVVDVYFGPTFNLLNQSSAQDIATILSYSKYVELTGHATTTDGTTLTAKGTLTGTTFNFLGSGLLDVFIGGFGTTAAQNYLNSNAYADGIGGFADISFTSSGNNDVLNKFDPTCTFQPNQFCVAGSANLRSPTVVDVPEPGILAMLGLGLMGMGAFLRKRKAV